MGSYKLGRADCGFRGLPLCQNCGKQCSKLRVAYRYTPKLLIFLPPPTTTTTHTFWTFLFLKHVFSQFSKRGYYEPLFLVLLIVLALCCYFFVCMWFIMFCIFFCECLCVLRSNVLTLSLTLCLSLTPVPVPSLTVISSLFLSLCILVLLLRFPFAFVCGSLCVAFFLWVFVYFAHIGETFSCACRDSLHVCMYMCICI